MGHLIVSLKDTKYGVEIKFADQLAAADRLLRVQEVKIDQDIAQMAARVQGLTELQRNSLLEKAVKASTCYLEKENAAPEDGVEDLGE